MKICVHILNSAWMKICVRILNSAWMKICVPILNTVLTEGRIILWAGGSLADDGSTVKTSVPIFNSVWMKICGHILNSAWMKICVRILKYTVPRNDVEEMRTARAREGRVGKQKH